MNWERVMKKDWDAKDSEQGLHVTKFYQFLKRYFAPTHTPMFLKYFIPYDELGTTAKRDLYRTLQSLLGDLEDVRVYDRNTDERPFPGITIKAMKADNIELEFNDAEHIANRNEHVESSREYQRTQRDRARGITHSHWWTKPPPYDEGLQSAYRRLTDIIKRTSWKNQRWGPYANNADNFW
mgnify:CR=1 FL=1